MKNILLSILFLSATYLINGQDYENEFSARANLLIEHLADYYPRWNNGERPIGYNGGVADFGKYNYPKILALFAKYGVQHEKSIIANERLDIYKTKETFHFNLVGLPRIMYMFPDAPGIKNNRLEFLKRVWERNDSYNAWTCEGTENHIGMSRTAAYLYAQLASEFFPDSFPDAKEKMAEIKKWIHFISQNMFYAGTTEWNSSTYNAYNIIGWINLYDFAKDPEVKIMAKAAVDYYACETAINYFQGMMSGSDMRGKGCTHSFYGSASYLGWLWYGDSPRQFTAENLDNDNKSNTEQAQSIHAALSTYRPPAIAVKLAKRKLTMPIWYNNSKPSYLLEDTSYIKQNLYVEKNFTLGAAYLPYGGWSGGNYQIIPWKLIARVDTGKSAQFISGFGIQTPSKYFTGNHRMPFDQLVQYKNVLIQMTKVPAIANQIQDSILKIAEIWKKQWEIDFKKRFPTDKDHHNPVNMQQLDLSTNQSSIVFSDAGKINYQIEKNILFVQLENVFLAIRSIRGESPDSIKPVKDVAFHYTNVKAPKDMVCGFIIEVTDKKQFKTFDDYKKRVILKTKTDKSLLDKNNIISYTSLSGTEIKAQYVDTGSYKEPIFDWGYGPEKPMVIQTAPPFKQPVWPSGKGHGKIARWWINGKLVELNNYWPVYNGPNIYIGKGILNLTDSDGSCYSISFTENLPVFRERCIR